MGGHILRRSKFLIDIDNPLIKVPLRGSKNPKFGVKTSIKIKKTHREIRKK